jgi:hypothetical protein
VTRERVARCYFFYRIIESRMMTRNSVDSSTETHLYLGKKPSFSDSVIRWKETHIMALHLNFLWIYTPVWLWACLSFIIQVAIPYCSRMCYLASFGYKIHLSLKYKNGSLIIFNWSHSFVQCLLDQMPIKNDFTNWYCQIATSQWHSRTSRIPNLPHRNISQAAHLRCALEW